MIPKIIHYCWFGQAPLPPLAEECIASWKKHMPSWQIMRWDETTLRQALNQPNLNPSLKGRTSGSPSLQGRVRDRLIAHLNEHGIGTVIHYPIAPHKQECYKNHPSFQGGDGGRLVLPITEMLADCKLSLPMSPCMTQEQVEYVVDTINAFK